MQDKQLCVLFIGWEQAPAGEASSPPLGWLTRSCVEVKYFPTSLLWLWEDIEAQASGVKSVFSYVTVPRSCWPFFCTAAIALKPCSCCCSGWSRWPYDMVSMEGRSAMCHRAQPGLFLFDKPSCLFLALPATMLTRFKRC